MTRTRALFIVAVLVGSCLPAEARQSAASYRLSPLKVEGAKRYTTDDLAKLGGLQPGQSISLADLQAAADRLAASGLFKQLRFGYETRSAELIVTFEVEEAPSSIPVVFDNFIWFPGDEVMAMVRKDVPAFDGTLPETVGAPDLVIRSLQALLTARGIPGTVVMTPQADLKTKGLRYIFSVTNPAPIICDVSVSGTTPAIQREALDAAKTLAGQTYSHFYLTQMSAGTLQDIYRRHGRLRAAIVPIAAKSEAASCAGANVLLRVDEGPAYTWAGAVWSGNAVAATADLDKLLGMRPGELADDSKVRSGLRRITATYGRNGFIMFSAAATFRLNDESKTAVFEFAVSEGPQFRMGNVEIVGLPERDAEALRRRWKLATGATFDDAYPGEFLVKEATARQPEGKSVEIQTEMNRTSRTVNVRVIFK